MEVNAETSSESRRVSTDKGEPARPQSPPPNCAICLGECKNKCFTDSCLHQFCYKCLVTWSKVKPECPLCKQTFKSIIHNVKSNQHYDEYLVEPPLPFEPELIDMNYFEEPRFRYRTTFTLHRHESLALERLLMQLPPMTPPLIQSSFLPVTRRSRRGTNFRQSVYRHNLWANMLADITGRYRECSPEFYRENVAQVHRLMPWLQRELSILVPENTTVINRITDLLSETPILSNQFRIAMVPFIGRHTDHFIHEFYSYATSPYDMVGYDRTVQYVPEGSRSLVTFIPEVPSGDSDNNSDNDSDIVLISPATTPPISLITHNEPSTSNGLNSLSDSVIAIETMSHSDSEDSSGEVVVVGYIKPPHERTPEVVDLASDSDAMIIEDEINSPIEIIDDVPTTSSMSSSINHPIDVPSTSGLVKIKLKRNGNGVFQSVLPHSSSDEVNEIVNTNKRKSKHVKRKHKKSRFLSRDSASTEDTDRDTDIDMDSKVVKGIKVLQKPDDSDCSDSDYSDNKYKRLAKRKQKLASKILKKFKKLNKSTAISQAEPEDNIQINSSDNPLPSTSTDNFNKKTSQKKEKRKKHSGNESFSSNTRNDSKKLKLKGRSKSKEKLINKIFENGQVNDSSSKSVDSSKAKAKNKLFNKSFNKHVDLNAPSTSTSTQYNNHFSSSDLSENDEENKCTETPNNLLDILSKSILKPNNNLLSINNVDHSLNTTSTNNNAQVPNSVKHFIDEINDAVFRSQCSPLNLSNNRDCSSD